MRKQDAQGRWIRQTPEERFWEHVDKLEGENACWRWTGQIESVGYGRLTDYWTKTLAHRFSYELLVGPIPKGKNVLHRCDNRWCVRPEHLFVGSQADNMADMRAKGRARRGTPNPKRGEDCTTSKLTAAQVQEIRSLWPTVSMGQLAANYGVSKGLIANVVHRRAWAHID